MPSGYVLVAAAAIALVYYGGKTVYTHVGKPVNHAVCRAVTLGHKCKPKSKIKKPVVAVYYPDQQVQK